VSTVKRWSDMTEKAQRAEIATVTGRSVDDIERCWTERKTGPLFALIGSTVFEFTRTRIMKTTTTTWSPRSHAEKADDCWCTDETLHIGDVHHVEDPA
jgi:hypothetical protein